MKKNYPKTIILMLVSLAWVFFLSSPSGVLTATSESEEAEQSCSFPDEHADEIKNFSDQDYPDSLESVKDVTVNPNPGPVDTGQGADNEDEQSFIETDVPEQVEIICSLKESSFGLNSAGDEKPVLNNNGFEPAGSIVEIQTISDFDMVVDIAFDSSESWVPIGDLTNPFAGSFDGQNFIISGLYSSSDSDYIGFFGYTSGATLKNINLENVNIGGGRYVGGLVGSANNTKIANCSVTGTVTGSGEAVGGLVGYANRSSITTSSADCVVSGLGDKTQVGGLVGGMFVKNSIEDSYSSGLVEGSFNVGGLVGRLYDDNDITNCYSTATVNGNGDNTGGLIGFRRSSGKNLCSDSFWDIEQSGQTNSALGEGKTSDEMKRQETYTNWDFDTTWSIDEGQSYPILVWQITPEKPVDDPGTEPETPGEPTDPGEPAADPNPGTAPETAPGKQSIPKTFSFDSEPDLHLPEEMPATFPFQEEGFFDYVPLYGNNYKLVYWYLEEAERIIAYLRNNPDQANIFYLSKIRNYHGRAKILISLFHYLFDEPEKKILSERLEAIDLAARAGIINMPSN